MNGRTALMRMLAVLGMVSLALLAGCGGDMAAMATVTEVTVSPSSATVVSGGVQAFKATVSPLEANQAVNWSLSGDGCTGASCGTIVPTGTYGVYGAPATTVPNPAAVMIVATSRADSTKAATAMVTIIPVPKFSLDRTSLAFGNQAINTTSAPMTVTLTNTGTAGVSVDAVISGFMLQFRDFAETNDCGYIAAGTSCTFSVTFTPTATGDRIAYLFIDGDDGFLEVFVYLTGTGTG